MISDSGGQSPLLCELLEQVMLNGDTTNYCRRETCTKVIAPLFLVRRFQLSVVLNRGRTFSCMREIEIGNYNLTFEIKFAGLNSPAPG